MKPKTEEQEIAIKKLKRKLYIKDKVDSALLTGGMPTAGSTGEVELWVITPDGAKGMPFTIVSLGDLPGMVARAKKQGYIIVGTKPYEKLSRSAARLERVARILDRAERWQRLAVMLDDSEVNMIIQDEEDKQAGCEVDSEDEEVRPALVGSRPSKTETRYKMEPGHGQHLSDLLRTTAQVKNALKRLKSATNGA